MRGKKTIAILPAAVAIIISACFKDPVTGNNGNYLRFNNATLHIANKQGATGSVMIQSNTNWQLSIEAPVPDWMVMSKTSGTQSDSLVVTATKDNITGGYKFANIIATPVNNATLLPVRMTVVQYDSSYKGK